MKTANQEESSTEEKSVSSLRLLCASLIFLIAVTLFASTPSSGNKEEELPKGQIIEKVSVRADPKQSCALYLPSRYTADKKWPILYAFDPAARGRVPVSLFKDAAEKYGYIVAGSNNSRNGENVSTAVTSMLKDTNERFSIDERRIYTAGFSGGARVACSVGLGYPGLVAGVIACSGGFPQEIKPSRATPFVLFATAGTEDFNFPEMARLHRTLDGFGVTNEFEIFAGGHDWPPPELCLEALEWIELQAMKAGKREKDEALIDALFKRRLESARALDEARKNYDAYLIYEKLAGEFRGLKDVSEFEKRAEQLKSSKEVKEALKSEQEQERKQQTLMEQFYLLIDKLEAAEEGEAALQSFKSGIAALKKRADAGADTDDRRVARRVLQQLFVGLYEGARAHYKRKDYSLMATRLELAAEIRPDNARLLYDLASAYALGGRKRKALDALGKAVADGYSDVEKIKTDDDLTSLRGETEFKRIVASLEKKGQ